MSPKGYVTDRAGELLTAAKLRVLSRDETTLAELEGLCRGLLEAIGEDPDREGLKGTPRRFAAWWLEFIGYQDHNTETTFEAVHSDQMVVVRGMRVWSLCEHHLLPFWCDLTVGYLAGDRIIGLSKVGRIAQVYAHRLQVQERLTMQVADHLAKTLGHSNVAVLGSGEHLCMTMRGAKMPQTMRSSVLRGVFRDEQAARQEFFHLAGR